MLGKPALVVALLLSFIASGPVMAADVADASGAWQLTVVDTGRTSTPMLILEQDGETLTGIYRNSQGDNPARGSENGSEVTMSGEITGRDGTRRWVTYIGVIDADSMRGKFQTDRTDVNFTAERVPL